MNPNPTKDLKKEINAEQGVQELRRGGLRCETIVEPHGLIKLRINSEEEIAQTQFWNTITKIAKVIDQLRERYGNDWQGGNDDSAYPVRKDEIGPRDRDQYRRIAARPLRIDIEYHLGKRTN